MDGLQARPHVERIRFELSQIRNELLEEVARIPDDHFNWAPSPGMKPYRDLLIEAGVMEQESQQFMRTGAVPNWDSLWNGMTDQAVSLQSLLSILANIREETLRLLDDLGEIGLQSPLPCPESWNGFFGAAAVEPEELFRWIARHEYYHLGQIVIYHWLRGDDPYKRNSSSG